MKRLQIYIDVEVDEALGVIAIRERTSKAALIRKFVAERLKINPAHDPLDVFVGDIDEDPGDIDDIVYGS